MSSLTSIHTPILAPAEPNEEWAQVLQQHLTTIVQEYLTPEHTAQVLKAYHYAFKKHASQQRASGECYITHPVGVAITCARWNLDAETICAALLHDVVEDQGVSLETITQKFGTKVAELVDGVSKLDKIQFTNQIDADAENLRKMLMAMSNDVRVILIKLADRLHNMHTLGALPVHKIHRIARETLEIYVPIANRLGLNFVYRELQDLGFRHLYPMRYSTLKKAIGALRGGRREIIENTNTAVANALKNHHISAELSGREKNLYGIYRKMKRKHCGFEDVTDIYGIRVIVETLSDCYLALGALHGLYKPIPGSFKDYIAIPKNNGYQSLHTTLLNASGVHIEFQIRTRTMHYLCESGVAAHWMYKDQDQHFSVLEQNTLNWLKSVIDLPKNQGSSAEFLEHIKVELFPDSVYVFTPKGSIISLPRLATALDFAYYIHTDIGHHAVSCRINATTVSLRTPLKNGDIIEITTAPQVHPTPASLHYVHTARARASIRNFLRISSHNQLEQVGYQLFARALMSAQINPQLPESISRQLLESLHLSSMTQLYEEIGMDKHNANILAGVIKQFLPNKLHRQNDVALINLPAPITIDQDALSLIHLAPCCTPIPGDTVIGRYRYDRGMTVHTIDCEHDIKKQGNQSLDLTWGDIGAQLLPCAIQVVTIHAPGVLAKVASAIGELNVNIIGATLNDSPQLSHTAMNFTIEIRDRKHLAQVFRAIRRRVKPQKLQRL